MVAGGVQLLSTIRAYICDALWPRYGCEMATRAADITASQAGRRGRQCSISSLCEESQPKSSELSPADFCSGLVCQAWVTWLPLVAGEAKNVNVKNGIVMIGSCCNPFSGTGHTGPQSTSGLC